MGWDAYAVTPGVDTDHGPFLTPELEEVFRKAGSTTWLDGTCCGLLRRATGIPDYDETSVDGTLLWSPETVRKAHASANWDIPLEEFEEYQRAEELLPWARDFLKLCASNGLGIWFSW